MNNTSRLFHSCIRLSKGRSIIKNFYSFRAFSDLKSYQNNIAWCNDANANKHPGNANFLIVAFQSGKWNSSGESWRGPGCGKYSGMCHLLLLQLSNIRGNNRKHKHYEKVFLSAFYCCITLRGEKSCSWRLPSLVSLFCLGFGWVGVKWNRFQVLCT